MMMMMMMMNSRCREVVVQNECHSTNAPMHASMSMYLSGTSRMKPDQGCHQYLSYATLGQCSPRVLSRKMLLSKFDTSTY
eukprot:6243951-Amphidinium_carterae.2